MVDMPNCEVLAAWSLRDRVHNCRISLTRRPSTWFVQLINQRSGFFPSVWAAGIENNRRTFFASIVL
jgi:hypothetical protein